MVQLLKLEMVVQVLHLQSLVHQLQELVEVVVVCIVVVMMLLVQCKV
jgi:hypothetical protein